MKSVGMEFNAFFSDTFGKGIKEMLTENVLDPIREALSSVKEFLGGGTQGASQDSSQCHQDACR